MGPDKWKGCEQVEDVAQADDEEPIAVVAPVVENKQPPNNSGAGEPNSRECDIEELAENCSRGFGEKSVRLSPGRGQAWVGMVGVVGEVGRGGYVGYPSGIRADSRQLAATSCVPPFHALRAHVRPASACTPCLRPHAPPTLPATPRPTHPVGLPGLIASG